MANTWVHCRPYGYDSGVELMVMDRDSGQTLKVEMTREQALALANKIVLDAR